MSFGISEAFAKGKSEEDNNTPPATPAGPTPPVEGPIDPTPPANEPTPSTDPPADPPADPTPPANEPVDLSDEELLNQFNKKNNTNFASLEDITKPAPNKYESLLDEQDRNYYQFKEQTGGTREQWNLVNQNVDDMSPIDLARQRVREETGNSRLSDEGINDFLEKSLGIDFSEENLSNADQIALAQYAKPQADKLKDLQEKYQKPQEQASSEEPKYVRLESGELITEDDYNQRVDNHTKYQADMEQAVNSVAAETFDIEFGEGDDKFTIGINYDFNEQDKQSMLSEALNVDATIQKRYGAEDGFNHQGLAKALWLSKPENLKSLMTTAIQQAIAQDRETQIQQGNNENFNNKPLEKEENYEEYSLKNVAKKQSKKTGGFGM